MTYQRAVTGALDFLFERVALFVTTACLALALAVMAAQVVFRYALGDSLAWAEEVARYALIWSSMVGAAVAYRHGSHVAVTDFVVRLPALVQAFLARGIHLLVLAFSVMLTWQSLALTLRTFTRNEVTVALEIPIAWVHLALPVSGVLLTLVALEAIWRGPRLSAGVTAV